MMHLTFRITFTRKFFAFIESPTHVVLSITDDFLRGLEFILRDKGMENPFLPFEDSFARVTSHYLTKKNFPFLPKINEAILHFHENGLMIKSVWITEYKW